MNREGARQIDEAAASWMARLDRGLTEAEETHLQAWLAADDRHVGALGRMRALSAHSERAAALGVGFRPEAFRSAPRFRRRGLLQFGLAVLGGAAAAGGGVAFWLLSGDRYGTRRGEVRVIVLPDGSVMTLDTLTTATVHYSRGERLIALTDGEALFEVAKDAARPFIVSAGPLQVRAVGTAFKVRLAPDDTQLPQVLVQEGVVEARAADVAVQPVRLSANMRGAVTPTGLVVTTISASQLERELIWREGRILFAGESLAKAAAEFARYSDIRIVIDDPTLAREEISGSFHANDPIGFGRAMAEALGAQVAISEHTVRLFR